MFLSTKGSGARKWCGVAIANTRSTRSIGHKLISLFAIVTEDFLEAPENNTPLTFYMIFRRTTSACTLLIAGVVGGDAHLPYSASREAVDALTRIRAGSCCY